VPVSICAGAGVPSLKPVLLLLPVCSVAPVSTLPASVARSDVGCRGGGGGTVVELLAAGAVLGPVGGLHAVAVVVQVAVLLAASLQHVLKKAPIESSSSAIPIHIKQLYK